MTQPAETAQLEEYVTATLASPVNFGKTFERHPNDVPELVAQLGGIAIRSGNELVGYAQEGMGWDEPTAKHVVYKQVMDKMLAFYVLLGLTDRRVETDEHRERLADGGTAIALMYLGDQSMDRGDGYMQRAASLLGIARPEELVGDGKETVAVRVRLKMLSHIEEKIRSIARPEDMPYVLECFYEQVLQNEARIQELSQDYLASGRDPAFITERASLLAELATTSAGFPSVSRGLYATYRSHDESFGAPLAEITADPQMQEAERVWNAIVRLWDEGGDWEMDSGKYPDKGVFVINPFNQYDPALVAEFCELACITDADTIGGLQEAFANFHNDDSARERHGAHILETLRAHVRNYTNALPEKLSPEQRERFGLYIDICKRVLEIGYVNKIGDIALSRE